MRAVEPVLCLITDRRRWPDEASLLRAVGVAARAGVHLVQVREPDMDGAALAALVRRCLAAVAHTRARVLVNERLDVALAVGAHGVHLRETSMPAERVRTMAPHGFVIGRSVHSADGARHAAEAGGLDYLVFGPVFPTRSKPEVVPAGPAALAAAVAATPLPVLALGGVGPAVAGVVGQAGAAGVAAIGFWAETPTADLEATIQALVAVFTGKGR